MLRPRAARRHCRRAKLVRGRCGLEGGEEELAEAIVVYGRKKQRWHNQL